MRNNFEKDIYKQLVKRFGKGNVEYEALSLRYVVPASYTPDFRILDNGETRFLVESKGYFRKEDMRNLRAIRDCNPEIDLRILFQRDSKYTKTMRYSDWAEKYGFPYAIDKVPNEWR